MSIVISDGRSSLTTVDDAVVEQQLLFCVHDPADVANGVDSVTTACSFG
jgi:hypothetical protein